VRVEPLEFISSGGRGGALSRQVKRHVLTFYEGMKMRITDPDKRDFFQYPLEGYK